MWMPVVSTDTVLPSRHDMTRARPCTSIEVQYTIQHALTKQPGRLAMEGAPTVAVRVHDFYPEGLSFTHTLDRMAKGGRPRLSQVLALLLAPLMARRTPTVQMSHLFSFLFLDGGPACGGGSQQLGGHRPEANTTAPPPPHHRGPPSPSCKAFLLPHLLKPG